MKLSHSLAILAAATFTASAPSAFADTFHFGEGQSSVSGGPTTHQAKQSKHRKHAATQSASATRASSAAKP